MSQQQSKQKLDLLIKYIESFGIDINIGKNKARGNKGIFIHKQNNFRIDISKNADKPINTLIHEFAHYIHSLYDKNLNSLNFLFGELNDEIREELIKITVEDVPKDFAQELYIKKDNAEKEIKRIGDFIKSEYSNFKLSESNREIEKTFSLPEKYLLKYDKVRCFNKVLSIENLENDCPNLTSVQYAYIRLKSKKRFVSRISSKISRLNKYYNQPTELFARFLENYFLKKEKTKIIAPKSCEIMDNVLRENRIKEFEQIPIILE